MVFHEDKPIKSKKTPITIEIIEIIKARKNIGIVAFCGLF